MDWMDLFIQQEAPTKHSGPTAFQQYHMTKSPMNYGPGAIPYPSGAGSLTQPRAATIDYLNADMAKHYKMGKASAYQEALANTSYQRSVADMKAAGLNPAVIFGAGRGTGASSSVYASSGVSRSSSGRGYYQQDQDEKAFSGSEYSMLSTIGGLIGIALTGRPDGFWIGSQTAQGAMGLIDSIGGKSGIKDFFEGLLGK